MPDPTRKDEAFERVETVGATGAAGTVPDVGSGDPGVADDAFVRLYRAQWSAAANYAAFRLGPDEAEDAAADAFARAWARRETFDARRGTPSAWLWAIVRNTVTDRQRRAHPAPAELSPSTRAPADVEGAADRAEALRRAARVIATLPEVDQEIIALRFGAGLTNGEIAAHLGRNEGNVALRLHRAFRRVRERLEGEDVR